MYFWIHGFFVVLNMYLLHCFADSPHALAHFFMSVYSLIRCWEENETDGVTYQKQ